MRGRVPRAATLTQRASPAAALALAALVAAVPARPAAAQSTIACESREYQYAFCPVAGGVEDARLREQRSRSDCIEGRTWGWDRGGVWVDRGCEGVFEVRAPGPPAGGPTAPGAVIACESRNYQYAFCRAPMTIASVALLRQRSGAQCVEGRTWGWRADGVWVSGGCEGEFELRPAQAPGPVGPAARQGLLVCESRDGGYTFCPTGRLRSAELVQQSSVATCEQGSTWGFRADGVWVDRGCAGAFAIRPD
jgi:hypothetical protein